MEVINQNATQEGEDLSGWFKKILGLNFRTCAIDEAMFKTGFT